MKNAPRILVVYGVFLIVVGLIGFLSNPEKAKTALLSGGTFGLISMGLGLLAGKGWKGAIPAGLGLAAFLGATFIWRSSVSWMAVAGGEDSKLTAAILISTMLAGTIALAILLVRSRRQSTQGAAPALTETLTRIQDV